MWIYFGEELLVVVYGELCIFSHLHFLHGRKLAVKLQKANILSSFKYLLTCRIIHAENDNFTAANQMTNCDENYTWPLV